MLIIKYYRMRKTDMKIFLQKILRNMKIMMYICALFSTAVYITNDRYRKFFLDNVVVAHRGAWKTKGIPQNSIESFREAIRLGCAGSEFDVHITADDVFVLCHENTYAGKVIEKHTYKELAETKLPNGETVPTLEKTLMEGMKQTDTRLFLEIKPSSTVEKTVINAEKIAKKVNEMGAQPWIYYISSCLEALKRVKQLSPSSPVACLDDSAKIQSEKYMMPGYIVTDDPEQTLFMQKMKI
jgi:glycerophosphoryl diester phosphodiesterase